jgi:hypothetical protein
MINFVLILAQIDPHRLTFGPVFQSPKLGGLDAEDIDAEVGRENLPGLAIMTAGDPGLAKEKNP